MRGKGIFSGIYAAITGITPARAGKRTSIRKMSPGGWDHPRACGEKGHESFFRGGRLGSPPRVRGKEYIEDEFYPLYRITPARAGKSTES